MRASRILRLARTMRCAVLAAGSRKALATSGVDSPPRQRRVSAVWAGSPSAGWQQVKNSRSRSSGTSSSSTAPGPFASGGVRVGLDLQLRESGRVAAVAT